MIVIYNTTTKTQVFMPYLRYKIFDDKLGLITNCYIKTVKFEKEKCLRLTSKCKKYLKENYPERFSDCFIGASSTNKIRNDDYRRQRYHRLGEVLVMLNLSGVKIFADEKSLMKKTHGFTRSGGTDWSDFCAENNTAEFYVSAELKAAGLFMNARTSRALGIIYSYPDVYIIYNVADGALKWENKTEESFFYRAHHVFSWNRINDDNRDPISSNRKISFSMTEMDRYREMMKGNIEYDILAERNPNQKAMLDEIVELMVETVCSKKETTTIASNTYPTEVVKSKFLKINSEHIEYILECMSKNTTQVRDIKKYMLATIFNAPNTIDSYYATRVNHDLYG